MVSNEAVVQRIRPVWRQRALRAESKGLFGAKRGNKPWRLGQHLLALLEVPDGLPTDLFEPLLEPFAQDAGAGGG